MARQSYLAKRVTDQDATMRWVNDTEATINPGDIVKVSISETKAIAGVALETIYVGGVGSIDIANIYDIPTGTSTTFAGGSQVFFDVSAGVAIPGTTLDEGDFCLGSAHQARATSDKAFVRVRLNFGSDAFTVEGDDS